MDGWMDGWMSKGMDEEGRKGYEHEGVMKD